MLVKVGRFYLTLGTFTLHETASGDYHLILAGNLPIVLERAEALEITAVLDEAIAGQKTVAQIVTEQRAQSDELNRRAEALQQREQYVEGIAQQVMAAQGQQRASGLITAPSGSVPMPGFGRKKRG